MHVTDQAREAFGTGYRIVQSSTSCVLTRFQLRSPLSVLRFLRFFRRIRKDASRIDGHILSLFFIENWRTCYTLSLWRDPHAILAFNAEVHSHIRAANVCFHHLQLGPKGKGAMLWSAEFSLTAVSPYNSRWDALSSMSGADSSQPASVAPASIP
jgi:hypothetical protein